MAATQFNSLERVFSRRDLFRGKSLQALIWGVFASLALCLLLVDVFLIAELLETRGRLVEESEALRYSASFHRKSTRIGRRRNPARTRGVGSAIARIQQEEAGLRPAVLRQRDVPVLGPFSRSPTAAFRGFAKISSA